MKKIFLPFVLITMLLTACGGETKLSAEKAKEIALNHAGVLAEDAVFVRTEKDRDNGKTVYEVEFYSKDNREFDYEIDAETGEIVSFDQDAENYLPSSSDASQNTSQQTEQITENKAKEIALAKVPGATDSDIREFKKDFDDGREEYEGKIIYNNTEYEFEINAQTGEIITWETESVFD